MDTRPDPAPDYAAHVFYVDGKRVKLRDRIPLKTSGHLPKLFSAIDEDWHNIARLGMLMVEEWDFEGRPDLMSSWDELDAFTTLQAFGMHIGADMLARQESAGLRKS